MCRSPRLSLCLLRRRRPAQRRRLRQAHLDITHTYLQPGPVAARVDVSWTGTFAVAGGPAAAIPGQVTVPGPEVAVRVREARSELVANP